MRTFKLACSGDTILLQPFPADYDGWKELKAFFDQADIRMNNMECPLSDYQTAASAYCGGLWICASPDRLDDLGERFGFDCYSFANNHTLDYFYDGLEMTLNAFRDRNLPVCGAGKDLAEATRHCKVESPAGSLAMLAITTTCDDSARAGDPKDPFPGRPGANKLRHSEQFRISEEHMAALKEIAEVTCIDGRANNSRKGGYLPTKPGIFNFGGAEFKIGFPEGKESIPNPNDMKRMEAAVRAAKDDADYVLVYVHSHEIRGMDDEETDFFLDTFCRSCVEWGADAVICSGTHQIKAMEFWQGKPIFYSVANFIFQVNGSDYFPMDYYERTGADLTLDAQGVINVRSQGGKIGLETESYCYRAILPMLSWTDGKLDPVIAKPIGLGFDGPAHLKGLPRSANEQETTVILSQLKKLSAPYGTKISLREDGMILFEP